MSNFSIYSAVTMQMVVTLFFIPCVLASVCEKVDMCHYPNTKPLVVSFLTISRDYIYPNSCLVMCMMTNGCVGVTLDHLEGMCHLYKESTSFGITEDPSLNLWLIQATGVPCIMVS